MPRAPAPTDCRPRKARLWCAAGGRMDQRVRQERDQKQDQYDEKIAHEVHDGGLVRGNAGDFGERWPALSFAGQPSPPRLGLVLPREPELDPLEDLELALRVHRRPERQLEHERSQDQNRGGQAPAHR